MKKTLVCQATNRPNIVSLGRCRLSSINIRADSPIWPHSAQVTIRRMPRRTTTEALIRLPVPDINAMKPNQNGKLSARSKTTS